MAFCRLRNKSTLIKKNEEKLLYLNKMSSRESTDSLLCFLIPFSFLLALMVLLLDPSLGLCGSSDGSTLLCFLSFGEKMGFWSIFANAWSALASHRDRMLEDAINH
jgi:hypothetical protein